MRVLVVEDNDETRLELVESLQKEGYSVEAAVNGKEAIVLLKESKFDFVLSDINMPILGGLELAEHLAGDPPMILYTSGNTVSGLKELADHFKVKIFMTNASLETIKNQVMSLFSKSVQDNTDLTNQICNSR